MSTVDLAFEQFGDVSKSPLVILHGFLASSRNWRSVAQRLSENRGVYVLDIRNHGASPHIQDMDYPDMAQDVLAFLDKRELPKASIMGHSMGGKVAMWLALHFPERIDNLIVADISPVAYEHSFDGIIDALRSIDLNSLQNRKQAEFLLAASIPDLSFRQFLLQNLVLRNGVYHWRVNLDFFRRSSSFIVGFPKPESDVFRGKVLFIGGQNSRYIVRSSVLKHFPNASFEVIPNTGHWLYVEAPGRFCELVDNWLVR